MVDHGSTDETPRIIAGYGERVNYVRRETDDGPCIACLDGILRSACEFVHIQYDDDRIAPEFGTHHGPLQRQGRHGVQRRETGRGREMEMFRDFNLASGSILWPH